MRKIKLAFLFVLVLALAILLAVNMRTEVTLVLDPFGLGYDALRPRSLTLPWLLLGVLAVGLFIGALLDNVAARRMRRELREKRDEALLLKAELAQARATLKQADHPASAGLPARR